MEFVEHLRVADTPMVGDGGPGVIRGPSLSHALVDRARRFLLQAVMERRGLSAPPTGPSFAAWGDNSNMENPCYDQI